MRRAFALLYCLVIVMLVVMFAGALLARNHVMLFASQHNLDRRQALYVAESGLRACLAELTENPNWTGGFAATTLPGEMGNYTVAFNQAAPGREDSVNNLTGLVPLASWRGPSTVPPGAAFIVCRGRYRSTQVRLEAQIVGGHPTLAHNALSATGKIHLQGNVLVRGIESFSDSSAVAAGIHSNLDSGVAITWTGPANQLNVDGKLSGVSATPVQLGSAANVTGGVEGNVPPLALPDFDIASEVAAQAGGPAGPAVPPAGTLALSSGSHYYGRDTTINGDLTLEPGARMYVQGKLKVNGTIRGQGSVFVDGNVEFYGDSSVDAAASGYMSVLSSGHVAVQGFDADSYLDALAAIDPANSATPPGAEVGESWPALKEAMKLLGDVLSQDEKNYLGEGLQGSVELDNVRAVVNGDFSSTGSLPAVPEAGKLLENALPSTPTGAFLRKRIHALRQFVHSGNSDINKQAIFAWAPNAAAEYLDKYDSTIDLDHFPGLLDILTSIDYDPIYPPPSRA